MAFQGCEKVAFIKCTSDVINITKPYNNVSSISLHYKTKPRDLCKPHLELGCFSKNKLFCKPCLFRFWSLSSTFWLIVCAPSSTFCQRAIMQPGGLITQPSSIFSFGFWSFPPYILTLCMCASSSTFCLRAIMQPGVRYTPTQGGKNSHMGGPTVILPVDRHGCMTLVWM